MSITVAQAITIAQLVELGLVKASQLRAMQDAGISDEQVLAYLVELDRVHQAHQGLDLREPA